MAFLCQQYLGLESCTVGEIMGIEQGLQWVCTNRPEETHIALYVDNLSVGQKLVDYVDKKTVKVGAYPALWMHLYALCDKFERIDVFHIESHQPGHNPNKTCDMLCAALLRPYKDGRETPCMPLSPQG